MLVSWSRRDEAPGPTRRQVAREHSMPVSTRCAAGTTEGYPQSPRVRSPPWARVWAISRQQGTVPPGRELDVNLAPESRSRASLQRPCRESTECMRLPGSQSRNPPEKEAVVGTKRTGAGQLLDSPSDERGQKSRSEVELELNMVQGSVEVEVGWSTRVLRCSDVQQSRFGAVCLVSRCERGTGPCARRTRPI